MDHIGLKCKYTHKINLAQYTGHWKEFCWLAITKLRLPKAGVIYKFDSYKFRKIIRGAINKDIINQQLTKDSARSLVRVYVIISIFFINSFLYFKPKQPAYPSVWDMAQLRFNISGLYQCLSSHQTATKPYFTGTQNSFLYIPLELWHFCDSHGLVMAWGQAHISTLECGTRGWQRFGNVQECLVPETKFFTEERGFCLGSTVKISATWHVPTIHTQRRSASW